ncbi:DUF5686 and carboxypeptidase regulatory-like domain-containing protein [Altibacter sp. HG106]|uniref:DUF5686 and carboxypeptidase regulatory-like domain-containing protein n=1 Tax=Altibacter sp. HG106 TaxID=3023937 RepID=UPI002350C314|nr:DUF5686 and carboxypeptidase regulatory-like domain-containing protein [Altibacter sp. HG106]MDC7995567.1 DUF5686 and carboxypeptidase regulatory-like domain-containing protein [Altibacter sp. HG106]
MTIFLRSIFVCLAFIASFSVSAQIVGKVTDAKGNSLPYVNIYLEGSYQGTTSNEEGNYELTLSKQSSYTISFQYLGYKKLSKTIQPKQFPFVLNVMLEEESISLDEVILSNTEDPAYRIIRETIAQRRENLAKISEFTADFYSRGLWHVENIPERVMGQEVGDFNGALDSTRSGIVYLSETISEIAYQHPNEFKETIIASKVSGDDNGFSFNSAQEANFSFYENSIELYSAMVSPIANNALNYYEYQLDGVFYEGNKMINKIKVIPKRPKDRVFNGYVYIVEDDWQLYGLELATNGQAIQVPMVEDLVFKQNFKYDETHDFWVKISQSIDFGFGFLGVDGDGRFIAVYSNYDFEPQFEKRSFTNEVLSFKPEANKKDSLFWKGSRPVPLTDEELNDYIRKDSIQTLRNSKPYLDSIDRKNNKPGILSLLTGYSFKNSFEKWSLNYDGPLSETRFNTVQGWNSKAGVSYYKWYDDNQTNWFRVGVNAAYGIAEDRVRFTASVSRMFNLRDRLRFSLSGGSELTQFNPSEPISPLINSVSTLFFERNYMKLYERNYAQLNYSQEVVNGLHLYAQVAYENRQAVFNNTGYTIFPQDDVQYTSNNPQLPLNEGIPGVIDHNIVKTQLSARINFGQKYFSNPEMKFNIGNEKYPELIVTFENGTSTNRSNYDFSQLRASLYQSIGLGNKGQFYYRLKGGTFFNGDGISFIDYQHFNGNQTRVGTSINYTNNFNLLPYYDLSTNSHYFEGHLEHDFRGWILGKIPGINQLNFNLIAGAHVLSIDSKKPYTEFSIGIDNLGIGKFRLLRLDYVRSYYNGVGDGAFIFGLKFLDLLD